MFEDDFWSVGLVISSFVIISDIIEILLVLKVHITHMIYVKKEK
jgi:hypothetical protein